MSTISALTAKIANLQDAAGANGSTPAQIQQGRAKAWINFDGTGTIASRDSFNISSITDIGVGAYQNTMAVPQPSTSYSPIGSACLPSPGSFASFNNGVSVYDIRTALTSAITSNSDVQQVGVCVMGD